MCAFYCKGACFPVKEKLLMQLLNNSKINYHDDALALGSQNVISRFTPYMYAFCLHWEDISNTQDRVS